MAATFNTYIEALTYFYTYPQYNPANTSHWNLDRMKALLARLGDPQKRYHTLLIAGTKGKGTTAAISESILRHAGYRTGLYTSPHLHSFRERIRIGGDLVSEETLVRLANRLYPHFEATEGLTAFELITALAFATFAEENADVAVLEVGLGGRLDATNAIDADVAVITSISYDHIQILGDTLTLIAREKAGIIRPGATVVSAPQEDEALQTIEQVCNDRQAKLTVIDQAWEWETNLGDLTGQSFQVCEETYHLPLIGTPHVTNAITAMAATLKLSQKVGLAISQQAMSAGIGNVTWRGRMEILNKGPYLILDSAMNGDSAEKLGETLNYYFPERTIRFIFGASADHPIEDMLEALCPLATDMVMAAAPHPRAATPKDLVATATEFGYQVQETDDVAATLDKMINQAKPDDVICATGSLFLVAHVRELWLKRQNLPLPAIDPLILS
ncbi:MAG: folylpolyglutamate synthase/dihydrofolate synthase family protein [Chloroflexota bacterium]